MFETEIFIDWNDTTLFKAKGFIERSLDRSGSTEYFICQVVDRINSQPSPLWNKEFLSNLFTTDCSARQKGSGQHVAIKVQMGG